MQCFCGPMQALLESHHYYATYVINKRVRYFICALLGVIRDKQEGKKKYFFCGPSPGMFLFISNL